MTDETAGKPSSAVVPDSPRVFVSYAREPSGPAAGGVQARLEERGVPVFIDTRRIDTAEQISPSIVSAIRNARVFLLFAGRSYFHRPYCLLELEAALVPGDAQRPPIPAVVLPDSGTIDLALLPPALADTHWPKEGDVDAVVEMVERLLAAPPVPPSEPGWPHLVQRPDDQAPMGPLPRPESLGTGFVGREDDAWQLYFRLALRRRTGKRASIALVGGAGFGKSTLVAEVLHRHGAEFSGGVHWVDAARTVPEIDAQLHTVLSALDPRALPLSFYRSKEHGRELLARHLEAFLDRQETSASTLFVLDNLPESDPEACHAILRSVPPAAHVVATSRAEVAVASAGFETLRLQPLDPGSGAALLARNLPDRGAIESWYPLVDWVGGLPLALDLLNRLLVARSISRDALLAKTTTSTDAVSVIDAYADAIRPHVPAGRVRGIAEAFELSFTKLGEDEKAGATALAWLAPTPIPETIATLLSSVLPPHVRATLAARSFVTPVRTEAKTFGRMHRLLAAYLQRKTPDPAALLMRIAAWLEQEGDLVEAKALMADLAARLPHHIAVFDHLRAHPGVEPSAILRHGLGAASLAAACDDRSAARTVYDRCFELDPDNLELRLEDARLRASQHDTAAAKSRLQALLRDPSLQDDAVLHADALLSATVLRLDEGEVETIAADLQTTHKILTEAIAAQPTDARTRALLAQLKMRSDAALVRAFLATGRVAMAQILVHEFVRRVSESNAVGRTFTYPLRVSIEEALEHWPKVLELTEQLAEDIVSLYGGQHGGAIAVQIELARARIRAGQVDDARQLLADTLEVRRDVFKTEPGAVRAMAMLSSARGNHVGAAEFWRFAQKMSRGMAKVEAASSRAEALIQAGRPEHARDVIAEALSLRDRKSSTLHVAWRRVLAVGEAVERPPDHDLAGVTEFGEFELGMALDVLSGLADAPVPLVLLEAIEPFVFAPALRAYLARRGVLEEAAADLFVVDRRRMPVAERRVRDPDILPEALENAWRLAGPEARAAIFVHRQHIAKRSTSWIGRAWRSVKRLFV